MAGDQADRWGLLHLPLKSQPTLDFDIATSAPQSSKRRHISPHKIGDSLFHNHLVAGIPIPSEKYEFITWDDEIPN